MKDLIQKHCVPCEGGTPPLDPQVVEKLLPQVPEWEVIENNRLIRRTFKFKNFLEAMKFVNKVAEIAEVEQHHPDVDIHYNKVTLTFWTHAIGGLSENDFIVAVKIDQL
ncbi:MAG TPA: 4a-hydroxytetrahydrobiopterin dehydratase [Candidatus Peribacteraceae bacterium]|nr:4a-hydroxytetrahydrobiopterin dehydratase [Candidatus Peribacteraceae bacterium]